MAELDITAKVLAEETGLTIRSIDHYRTGKRRPSFRSAVLLSKALDMELMEFYEDE